MCNVTYAIHAEGKSTKEIAAFDRILEDTSEQGASHGTRELLSILGGPPVRPGAGS